VAAGSVLDVAVAALVADPGASLGEVAEAAGHGVPVADTGVRPRRGHHPALVRHRAAGARGAPAGAGSGALRADVADFWLLQTFYSLVYVAAESVHSGHLAPRDAPALAVDTLVRGLGGPPPGKGTPG
jgi:hypothetical protein